VRCDIRTLASVYTGFSSPEEARTWGDLEGPPAALAALGAAFAGPPPWIREMF
jgi:predicted acetyltransferase